MDNIGRKFYQKTWFKNTILITIPTIISALGVMISLIPTLSSSIKGALLAIIVFLMVSLIGFVWFFSNDEDKIYVEYQNVVEENKKLTMILAHLEKNFRTNKFTVTTITEVSERWAKNINSFANNVLLNKKVSDKAWDKIKYYDNICENCKKMIKQYCNNAEDSNISVSFVLCKESETGEKFIHMVAHSDPESTRPNACKKEEKLSESLYHFAELIREEMSGIEVAVNNEEIRRIFKNVSRNTDLSKYTQYIAIPTYCTSHKLLGIFQIVTRYDCIIEEEKVNLLNFASDYVMPYSNLIVLADKISKGLYINPVEIQKEQ